MKKQTRITLCGAVLAALLLPAAAQNTTTTSPQSTTSANPQSSTTTTTTPSPVPPVKKDSETIRERKENQQDRIAKGIDDGKLNAGEAANLEKKESGLNQEEQGMRKLDNGHLTKADRQTLQRQQNQLSNQIHKDANNNDQRKPDNSEVGRRAENQQDRIAQGVQSGTLKAGQTAHVENEEHNINQEVAKDRAANGGRLTQQEKAQVNRQQNKVSKQIYKDKHPAKNTHNK